MSYSTIDVEIDSWAAGHRLHVYREYKGEEVRSIDLVDQVGKRCQIWIDRPAQDGTVMVHVWDYGTRQKDFDSTIDAVRDALELAYHQAQQWHDLSP